MQPWLTGLTGNPSSPHDPGRRARAAVDDACGRLAGLLNAPAETLVITSGGTESIMTALASAVALQPDKPLVLISSIEHSATRQAAGQLVGAENCRILPVDHGGRFDLAALADILRTDGPRLAVASLLWASNETGVLPGIGAAAAMLRHAGVLVHADAVQAVGKIPLDLSAAPVDMLSLSGHKFHAPMGTGALYIRPGMRFHPYLVGGGQQNGRRAGTENVAGIVGLGAAASLAARRLADGSVAATTTRRDHFEARLLAAMPDTIRIGDPAHRLGNTSCLRFPGCPATLVLSILDDLGLAASAGAACTSRTAEPPRGLVALGLSRDEAAESLRFSLGCTTSDAEIDSALATIITSISRVRASHSGARVVFQG